jgi:hypothetical protein
MQIMPPSLKTFVACVLPKMLQEKLFGLLNFRCLPELMDPTTEIRQAMQISISQTPLCLFPYSNPPQTRSFWSGFDLSFQIVQSWALIAEIWYLGWERFTALPNRCPPYFLAHKRKK